MKIILASGSPRRKELLEALNVKELEIIPARGEEKAAPGLAPAELVMELSCHKAAEVAEMYGEDAVVIGADTVVALDGKVLGKPRDEADARRMLLALSGREHEVFTGVTLIRGDELLSHAERTVVRFRTLTEEEIAAYIRTGEPMDKAGAYGAQGYASLFVEHMDGDFFNVMGLPVCALGKMLKQMGVNLL